MDTKKICEKRGQPVNGWQKLNGKPTPNAPDSEGVYVLRVANGTPFGRFSGESDVVYIGHGAFRTRLKQHLTVRIDARDKGWLFALQGQRKELEIGFFPCTEPKTVERDLLNDYFGEHLELPPANGRLERSKTHDTVRVMTALVGEKEVQKILTQTTQAGTSPREPIAS